MVPLEQGQTNVPRSEHDNYAAFAQASAELANEQEAEENRDLQSRRGE